MIDKFLDIAKDELKDFAPRGFTTMEIATLLINFLTIVFFLIPMKFIDINSELIKYYNLIWEFKWIVLWLIIMIVFNGIYSLLNKHRDDFGLLNIYRIKSFTNRFFCFYMSVYFLIEVFIIKSGHIKVVNISLLNIVVLITKMISFIIVVGNFIEMMKQLFKKDNFFREYENKREYMNYILNKYKLEDNKVIEKQLLLCQLYEITSTLYDKNVLLEEVNFEEHKRIEMYKKRNELNKKYSDKIY